MSEKSRTFESGATRDTDTVKRRLNRFVDSRVLQRYMEYMHKHRVQSDGGLREADNWKKGMPIDAYTDSLVGHTFDLWLIMEHGYAVRPETGEDVDLEEALCAIMFNAMGMLSEVLKVDPWLSPKGGM